LTDKSPSERLRDVNGEVAAARRTMRQDGI
jgi:hypothetical protein